MVHIVKKGGKYLENKENIFGGSSGDRVLCRIEGRGSISCIFGNSVKIMGGDKAYKLRVTLKGIFKRKKGQKWHILTLVDITDAGIEVRSWVVRCL